jgi:argonaute-like protein implicated in RNA metabolism and viral defense
MLSQNVTLDLINNASQFQWSAANIALGAFVKLAGIPWVVKGEDLDEDLIIGIGRAYLYDPKSRQTTGYMAFTACFSARGPLKFMSLAEVARTRDDYLKALNNIVKTTLTRAETLGNRVTSLTVHVPKEMQRMEMEAIRTAARSHKTNSLLQPLVIKVTEESSFFAVDDRYKDGIPRRGTAVQVSDRDYMLYTEGREEKEAWAVRLPVALRVTPQGETLARPRMLGALRQINDLSQVNWRGLNARSKPISIYYGSLIARILSHLSPEHVSELYGPDAHKMLQERMWFL